MLIINIKVKNQRLTIIYFAINRRFSIKWFIFEDRSFHCRSLSYPSKGRI